MYFEYSESIPLHRQTHTHKTRNPHEQKVQPSFFIPPSIIRELIEKRNGDTVDYKVVGIKQIDRYIYVLSQLPHSSCRYISILERERESSKPQTRCKLSQLLTILIRRHYRERRFYTNQQKLKTKWRY